MPTATREWLDEYLKNGGRIVDDRRIPGKGADAQRIQKPCPKTTDRNVPSDQAQNGNKEPLVSGCVSLTFLHYRHRLADGDGYYIKDLIDALTITRGGCVLADDNVKVIPQPPVHRHFKIGKDEPESTVSEIRRFC